MAAYATAALIRQVDEEFARTDANGANIYADATLTGWAENFGDKEIDARLESAGITTPLSEVPAEIKAISAKLAAAFGLLSFNVEKAAQLREIALAELEAIATG